MLYHQEPLRTPNPPKPGTVLGVAVKSDTGGESSELQEPRAETKGCGQRKPK